MYLSKIALDILSKHSPSNIGYLDEDKFKIELWHHKPLTDFWQIGKGIEKTELKRIKAEESHAYYRESGIHYVPKVGLEDLLIE